MNRPTLTPQEWHRARRLRPAPGDTAPAPRRDGAPGHGLVDAVRTHVIRREVPGAPCPSQGRAR